MRRPLALPLSPTNERVMPAEGPTCSSAVPLGACPAEPCRRRALDAAALGAPCGCAAAPTSTRHPHLNRALAAGALQLHFQQQVVPQVHPRQQHDVPPQVLQDVRGLQAAGGRLCGLLSRALQGLRAAAGRQAAVSTAILAALSWCPCYQGSHPRMLRPAHLPRTRRRHVPAPLLRHLVG